MGDITIIILSFLAGFIAGTLFVIYSVIRPNNNSQNYKTENQILMPKGKVLTEEEEAEKEEQEKFRRAIKI